MEKRIQQTMSTNLITVRGSEALEVAYAKMVKHEIRHLPVVDDVGHVIGILSDRDLQRALKSTVNGAGSFKFESCEFDPNNKVSDYMSWPVKSLEKTVPLKTAAQRMVNEKISAFVVMDRDVVVGIITTEDLIKVLVDLLADPKSSVTLSLEEFIANPRIGSIAQTIADVGI